MVSVRPKLGVDADGNIDRSAPSDTIEVHAFFTNEIGFFGLTHYLAYARVELRKAHDWTRTANQRHGTKQQFPWRGLDDTRIETEGFLRETYSFDLDQERILDLLTGHTLYNDTNVVIREIAQNSLDAIRLRQFEEGSGNEQPTPGRIEITWSSAERTLTVKDNGTGMTQDVIEQHLLKVGSSRYQDPQFIERYPDFSSISRFGIGVLSAFMVADTVEIVTASPDEELARYLSLRSVHGRYLIKLLNKESDAQAAELGGSGTLIKLSLRQSATLGNLRDAVTPVDCASRVRGAADVG